MNPGTLIQDRYELMEPIGQGGMAEVWLTRDRRLDRSVAIKFLARRFGEDADNLVRFFAEAQAVARIQHSGIVTVLDFGEFEDHPFLVMYYMAGGSLADLVGAPLPVERALAVVEQVARAVGAAHNLGIVHRDIKPGNILIDELGNPRLADFGIASSATAEQLTATGTAVGSPHYISPEGAQGAPTGPPSDVYSLGVVLYELVTGGKPFEGTVAAIAMAHVERIPARPSELVDEIPVEVDALIMRCLAKDAADRFEDGNELADQIRSLGIGGATAVLAPTARDTSVLPTSEDTAEAHTTPDRAAVAPPARRWTIVAGAIALTLLVAVGLFIFLGNTDETGGTNDGGRGRNQKNSRDERPGGSTPGDSSPPSSEEDDPGDEPANGDGGGDGGGGGGPGDGGDGGDGGDPDNSPPPSPPPSPDPTVIEAPTP
ncbi:MAG: serine/threonine-protein kinase [Actinomycetota bacterium]